MRIALGQRICSNELPKSSPHKEDSLKQPPEQEFSRRQLIRTGLTTAAAALLAGGLDLTFPSEMQAQSTLTPDSALNELMEGNKRYTSGKLTSFEHDLAILK